MDIAGAQAAFGRLGRLTRIDLRLAPGVDVAAFGNAGGFALAGLAVRWVALDLGSGYFRGVVPTLAIDPSMLALFFALGVAAASLGSVVPALDTARAPPAQALKAGDETRAFSR